MPLSSQIADGSIAPDFVVQDIEGKTHHLYDYLDDGKTVILDIASTWCAPCWNYLQIGALSDIHKIMGPDGLDQVIVLFIEAEPRNSLEQLEGTIGNSGNPFADNTHGNWIEEITYPIVDDASLGDLFEINSFPTIFKICPNEKRIYSIGQGSTNQLINGLLSTSCNPVDYEYDTSILRYIGTSTICAENYTSLPIEIVNLGQYMLNQATITISDGHTILSTQEWQGNLETYEREKVFLEPIQLENNVDLIFDIRCDEDDNMDNNQIEQFLNYAPQSSSMEVTIEIFTDLYGFENYWELRDDSGNVYAQGGNKEVGVDGGGPPYINQPYGEGAYDSFEYIRETVTLPNDGCYEFYIADDYGDGICCSYGMGYFKITDNQSNILVEGGQFADNVTYPFSQNENYTTAIIEQNADESSIILFPNPTNQFLNINRTSIPKGNYDFTIFNTLGQSVYKGGFSNTLSSSNSSIELPPLPSGLYYLSFTNHQGQSLTTPFVFEQ